MKKIISSIAIIFIFFNINFPLNAQTLYQCAGPVKPGWLVTDITTTYGRCGNYPWKDNWYTVVNTATMRTGQTLEICAWQDLPAWWQLTAPHVKTGYGRCGSYPYNNNIWVIQKKG